MPMETYHRGQTSVILRVKLLDSSSTTGAPLTGLTSASTGLIIGTIANNEATAVAYTVAGSTIETITTLGTYAAPTATKCRFKEVDSTNHKGLYEIQLADARFAVANAKSLVITISGATNLVQQDVTIPLTDVNPYVEPFQQIARLVYRSPSVYFVGTAGNDANDGLTPLTAKLTNAAAITASAANSTIIVESGEYSEGTTPVELKAGQGLYGAGMTRTRIHGTVDEATASKGTIVFADRTEVANLTGENTLASTTFGAAFAAYLLGTGAPITFRCSNVRAIADADGFYLRGTNSSQYVYGYLDDCVIDTKFDALARFTYSQVTARNCKITTIGPSATNQVTSRGVVSSGAGGVTLINCDVFAKDGGGTTLGIHQSGATVDMISECRVFTTDITGTVADLSVTSAGTMRVRDTAYSTTTGTGTATILNTLVNQTDQVTSGAIATAARSAVGMAAADLDTQISGIAASVWSYTTRLLTAVVNTLIPLQQKANWTLYRANSYSSTARDMTFTIATGATWPTDLSQWTWTLFSERMANNVAAGADTITGTVASVTATGSSRSLRVSITAANASLLALGQYRYALRGTKSTEVWDVVKGVIDVQN